VAFGDLSQHNPVKGLALWEDPKSGKISEKMIQGRQLWKQMDNCIILEKQYRFATTVAGEKLKRIVGELTTGRTSSGEEVNYEDLADEINDRAIQPEDVEAFLAKAPKALVLRHDLRPSLTKNLILHHAALCSTRVTVWRTVDTGMVKGSKLGRLLSTDVLEYLEGSGDNDLPSTVQYYYEGILYRFMDSAYPHIGRYKNGDCIGRLLVCDKREDPDDGEGDFRVLKYPPKLLLVEPVGRDIGMLCGPTFPSNTIPLEMETFTEEVKLPTEMKIFRNGGQMVRDFILQRKAHPIESVITFTDYYSQGSSFKGYPTFLHLGTNGKGSYKRGNFLVPLSRPSDINDVVLLEPLWPPNDTTARERFIRKFRNAIKPHEESEREMDRLQRVMYETVRRHSKMLEQHGFTVEAKAPQMAPEKVKKKYNTCPWIYPKSVSLVRRNPIQHPSNLVHHPKFHRQKNHQSKQQGSKIKKWSKKLE
jgi:hypothetical protein